MMMVLSTSINDFQSTGNSGTGSFAFQVTHQSRNPSRSNCSPRNHVMDTKHRPFCLAALVLMTATPLVAGAQDLELLADQPTGSPVGTTITWTATGLDATDYRLSAGRIGEVQRVIYDYSPTNTWRWSPIEDGQYVVMAIARDGNGQVVDEATVGFFAGPRAMSAPVVSATDHPLVALYSAPACAAGSSMRVVFRVGGSSPPAVTSSKPCQPPHTMNFQIGGLRGETVYTLRHQLLDADGIPVEFGAPLLFESGVPARAANAVVTDYADPASSPPERIVLQAPIGSGTAPFATDRVGRLLWYYDPDADGFDSATLLRPLAGGSFLIFPLDVDGAQPILREIDLAGNTLRETTAARVSEQLVARGEDPISEFHHDARRLPDGRTAVLAYVERILEDVQGEGPVNILGDMVIVLDPDWQVVWSWNSFEHMDVTRAAILGETCTDGSPGCPIDVIDDLANDWLHSNAIAYSPVDGNLLLSVRHQDWIVKFDYRDGAGTGEVIWRLGSDGDFALTPADATLWLSHSHDVSTPVPGRILLYDNGNVRCDLGGDCESRGQEYLIDESAMTAGLAVNTRLGKYSRAVGSAQPLANGNYHFHSGALPDQSAAVDEVLPDATKTFGVSVPGLVYRSFRLRSLYTPSIGADGS
jgi:arylsulfate sulfotransferase